MVTGENESDGPTVSGQPQDHVRGGPHAVLRAGQQRAHQNGLHQTAGRHHTAGAGVQVHVDVQHRGRARVLPHRLGPVPGGQAHTGGQQRHAVPQPQHLGVHTSERQQHVAPPVPVGPAGQTVAQPEPRLHHRTRVPHGRRSDDRTHRGTNGTGVQEKQHRSPEQVIIRPL